MVQFKSRIGFINAVGFGMGAAALFIVAGAVFANRTELPQSDGETFGIYHRVTLPQIENYGPPGCEAEAAAYAYAVVHLRNAQQLAEEAYVDWVRCLTGEDPPPPNPNPNPNPEPAAPALDNTFSILEN